MEKSRIALQSLSSETFIKNDVFIQQNEITLSDKWWYSIGFPSFTGSFYNMKYYESQTINRIAFYQDFLYVLTILPTKYVENHTREVYSLLSLIGDIGGVLQVILLAFVSFMNPISKYSFNMKAIQNLYLARSKDPSIFLPRTKLKTNKI